MRKYILILLVFLIIEKTTATDRKIGQNGTKFDERAIVVLGYLDWKQNVPREIAWPKVAFAIGDGTLLLTAYHCVDDFKVASDEPDSIDTVVVSPYYGDVYDFKIVAVDKQADIAILKAPWSSHPALKIADEEEFETATNILIASRPQANADKSFHLGRKIKTELLPVIYKQSPKPASSLRLQGTKQVVPGWSGSPMLIPDSGKIAGVLTSGIFGIKIKRLFGLITTTRNDAAGCNLNSIKALIKKQNLESAAFAPSPELKGIPDADRNFNLAMDFFEKLFTESSHDQFQSAEEFLKVHPDSIQAHLLLAFSATVMAYDPNNDRSSYYSLAEASYKKALLLDPNNANNHAVYGGFLKTANRDSEAMEQSNISLAIDPNNRMALFNKLMILGPSERKEVAEQILIVEPNNPRVLFYYSWSLSGIGENEKALEAAQKAVALDPNGSYYGALAEALEKLNRLDEAEPYYKLMAEKCGCQSCWFKYANFLYGNRKDKIKEAKYALEKSESLSHMQKISTENRNLLKLGIYEKTEPQKAENLAKEILKTSPDKGLYWHLYAGILRTLKKYDEAVEAAQKAVDLSPDMSYRPRLANCLAKAGELEKAEQIYDELHKESPEKYSYWFWYAEFLVDYFDDRIDEAKEALEKVPYNPEKENNVTLDDIKKLQEKINKR